jgi:hypothetical protein
MVPPSFVCQAQSETVRSNGPISHWRGTLGERQWGAGAHLGVRYTSSHHDVLSCGANAFLTGLP